MAEDWEARERAARGALDPLEWLVGEWAGEGEEHGRPVRTRLVGRRSVDGTFLELREAVLGPGGAVEWEDLVVVRWDGRAHRATHFQPPALVREHAADVLPDGGLRWWGGPEAPRVEFLRDGEAGLVVRVWLPGRDAPDVVVRYRRA